MAPTTESVKNLYKKVAKSYFEAYSNSYPADPYVEKFISLLKPGSTVLDIGCGEGGYIYYFLEKGMRVEGVDLSKDMISFAKERFPNVKFRVADMRTVKFDKALMRFSHFNHWAA